MARRPRTILACWAALLPALLAAAGTASAAPLLVLGGGGEVRADSRFAPGGGTPRAWPPRADVAPAPRARAAAPRRRTLTVARALNELVAAGAILPADRAIRLAAYDAAKATVRRLQGRRRVELAGVLADLEGMAARRVLTAPRLAPLWLTLQRNVEWWTRGPLLAAGQRIGFDGSELVWQHYPGHGVQIQWLGTFGKLNALWRSRRERARMTALTDESLALATPRAGGLAWESWFPFGGGDAPWVSALTQGTALQALSRSASRDGRIVALMPTLRLGLGIFQVPPPEGVRIDTREGAHYLQYSQIPGLFVLNGFIQSLVGLYDFTVASNDDLARALFAAGHARARAETPTFDTGAWSLYSRGTVTRESDLAYHDLLTDFLSGLCDRTADEVYCGIESNFEAYKAIAPVVRLRRSRLIARRPGALRIRVSKISRVTVEVRRGSALVLRRPSLLLRGGTSRIGWTPSRRGAHHVAITATDLAGNRGSRSATVVVERPPRRARALTPARRARRVPENDREALAR